MVDYTFSFPDLADIVGPNAAQWLFSYGTSLLLGVVVLVGLSFMVIRRRRAGRVESTRVETPLPFQQRKTGGQGYAVEVEGETRNGPSKKETLDYKTQPSNNDSVKTEVIQHEHKVVIVHRAFNGKVEKKPLSTKIEIDGQIKELDSQHAVEVLKFANIKYHAGQEEITALKFAGAADVSLIKGLTRTVKHTEKMYHTRKEAESTLEADILRTHERGRPWKIDMKWIIVGILGLGFFAFMQSNPQLVTASSQLIAQYGIHIVVSVTLISLLTLYVIMRRRRAPRSYQ